MPLEQCPDCGARVPHVPHDATHPYLGASAGCWARYSAAGMLQYCHR